MMHNEKHEVQHIWTCLPSTRQNQVVVAISHMVQHWLLAQSPRQRQATHNALDNTPPGDDTNKEGAETTIFYNG
jgi:hypothetical protein